MAKKKAVSKKAVSKKAVSKKESSKKTSRVATKMTKTLSKTTFTPSQLRTLRVAMGVSQVGLAEQLGVSSITVSRWENARSGIGEENLAQLQKLWDRYAKKMR